MTNPEPMAAPEAIAEDLPKGARGHRPFRLARILVPTDFSAASGEAFSYAVGLAGLVSAQVILMHVVEAVAYPTMPYFPLPMEPDRLEQITTEKLELMCQSLSEERRVDVQTLVRISDSPPDRIAAVARELSIDLIVIAASGNTSLTEALLGTTAERVVRQAPCPVLTVRPTRRDGLLEP